MPGYTDKKSIYPVRDRRNTKETLGVSNGVHRIIDANMNRAKEGLRVCEEITRFLLDNRNLTSSLKEARHRMDAILKRLSVNTELLRYRQSLKDVGSRLYMGEIKRRDCRDIFFANIQRVKESLRVLEEFAKLINKTVAIEFKNLRYDIYEIEKRLAQKISSLSCRR